MTTSMAIARREIRPGLFARLSGALAVLAASALLRVMPIKRVIAMVRFGQRCSIRPAAAAEAVGYLDQVDYGSRWAPGRVACLERSLATVLLAAFNRRQVTWCIGVRVAPPLAGHAWIRVGGEVIGEAPAFDDTYRTLIAVEDR